MKRRASKVEKEKEKRGRCKKQSRSYAMIPEVFISGTVHKKESVDWL
jgi:hypothetical protein